MNNRYRYQFLFLFQINIEIYWYYLLIIYRISLAILLINNEWIPGVIMIWYVVVFWFDCDIRSVNIDWSSKKWSANNSCTCFWKLLWSSKLTKLTYILHFPIAKCYLKITTIIFIFLIWLENWLSSF